MSETGSKLDAFLKGGGSKVVGAIVMWALSAVRAPRADLRAALELIGLGKAMPRDPTAARILSKAVQACASGHSGLIFRKLGKYNWAIVEEELRLPDGGGVELEHRHVLTLGVREETPGVGDYVPSVTVVGDQGPTKLASALASRVCAAYEDARDFASTDDMSVILTTAMAGSDVDAMLGGVNLRQGTGGVYFVPAGTVDKVLQLQAMVEVMAGGSHVTIFTLYGDQGNLDEAARAARTGFTAKLNELKGELGTFVAGMKANDKEMTDRHMETRINRLGTLDDRVDMWSDALGDVQNELRAQIEDAKKQVAEAMGL